MDINTEPGTSTQVDPEALMDEIADAGWDDSSDEGPGSDPTTPPTEGNSDDEGTVKPHQNPPTPGDGQPVEGEGKQVEPKDDTATPADGDAEAKTKAEEDERLRKELLGKSEVESDSIESLREKLSASSRESRENRDQLTAITAMLLDKKNLEIVTLKDGSLDLKAKDEYYAELTDDKIPAIELSQDEKDLFDTDRDAAIALVAKKTMAAVQAVQPEAIQGNDNVVVLSDNEQVKLFDEVAGKKLSNGTDMYPDMNTDEVKNMMADLYGDPASSSFADWMESDKSGSNYKFGLHLLYGAVHRVLAPAKAIQADTEAQAAATNKKNQEGLSSSDGSAVPDAGAGESDSRSAADVEMDRIADASYA